MKGGHSSKHWRRHSFFTIAALVFTTIFFWSWENNPLNVSLISTEEPFMMHAPDLFVDDSAESSLLVRSNNHLEGDDSVSQLTDDKRVDKGLRHSDSANMISIEKKGEKGDSASSLHEKGSVGSSLLSNAQELVRDEVSTSQLAEGGESTKAVKLSYGVSGLSSEVKDVSRNFASSKKKACNYAKGRWIPDSRRSLYSGFGCKVWLSDMWACRLTQRTDFSYEHYRWQPCDCEIPEFQGAEFLRKMQDKTLAFIGDSLGRQQFQSVMCMITGGKEMTQVQDVGKKYGLAKLHRAIRPDGWAYWFPETNTTVLYYWSASLCDVEPINATNPATEYAMHLDRPPAFLRQYLPQFHVVILNTGHHWNRGKLKANRWVMYANGKPVLDRKLAMMGNAKNHTLYSITRWFDSQISLHPHLKVFLRTISPRHFSQGEWNTGGRCNNLTPMLKGSQVVQDKSSDPVTESAVWGTKVKILDITALSDLRDEAHISHYSRKASDGINDCLHWCLPGIPDTWNELIYAQL